MTQLLKDSEHGFAFIPGDGKPDRLLRFKSLPDHNILSVLDVKHNILYINPTEYSRLPENMQQRLDRTHMITTRVVEDDGMVTFVDDILHKAAKPVPPEATVVFTFNT